MKNKVSAVFLSTIFFASYAIIAEARAEDLPDIPPGDLHTSDALKIREELEIIKKDVENKIGRLQEAKKSYDKSKQDVEEELKKVEEDKRLLEETLQKEKKLKEDRLDETLKFVSKIDPKKLAPMMEAMDRDLVLILLQKLPQRQITQTLENMTPAKATQFLEYYTRIRSGREFEMLKDLGLCAASQENDAAVKGKP